MSHERTPNEATSGHAEAARRTGLILATMAGGLVRNEPELRELETSWQHSICGLSLVVAASQYLRLLRGADVARAWHDETLNTFIKASTGEE